MSDSPNRQQDDQPMSEAQKRHHEELYNYKKDEEGTLDTSAMLDEASNGIPDTPTTGPDPEESKVDELLNPDFNNPIDDNNR